MMAKLNIIKYPDPFLEKTSKPVTNFDTRLHQLMDDMVDTMYKSRGIGLAAVQVGYLLRILVMDNFSEEDVNDEDVDVLEFVNPEIIKTSKKTIQYTEACLSVPGESTEKTRYEHLTVRAQNRFGKHFEMKLTDMNAIVFQHEFDHLNGILINLKLAL